MRVATINVDKAMATTRAGLESLPDESWTDFKSSTGDLLKVVEILLERQSRDRPGRKSSEKSPRGEAGEREGESGAGRPSRKQLPSERYPDVPVVEKELDFGKAPSCGTCGSAMKDSGLRETTERLTALPRKYVIHRFSAKKYKCGGCHGGMASPPVPARIAPGSSYGDGMILDVALSKYCDLIPVERYAAIAARAGLEGLPPNSLIGTTHVLADFLLPVYGKLKSEILASRIVHADETPHRMLEGFREKRTWYLWGFGARGTCFFDIRNTRAGSVAGDFLKGSSCEFLVSDVFSGYVKGVRKANLERAKEGRGKIAHAYCNAHARRKFVGAAESFPEAGTFVRCYKRIYRLEKKVAEGGNPEERARRRRRAGLWFNAMRIKAERLSGCHSSHSALAKACGYYLGNFGGLTRCLEDPEIPLDNNSQERLLRSPVVGRKTWYGTHSERGAKTAAVLFSVVEACKLNGVNPREYFPHVVELIHKGEPVVTPGEYHKALGKTGPPL